MSFVLHLFFPSSSSSLPPPHSRFLITYRPHSTCGHSAPVKLLESLPRTINCLELPALLELPDLRELAQLTSLTQLTVYLSPALHGTYSSVITFAFVLTTLPKAQEVISYLAPLQRLRRLYIEARSIPEELRSVLPVNVVLLRDRNRWVASEPQLEVRYRQAHSLTDEFDAGLCVLPAKGQLIRSYLHYTCYT